MRIMRERGVWLLVMTLGIACTSTNDPKPTPSDATAAIPAPVETTKTVAPETPLVTPRREATPDDPTARDPFASAPVAVVVPPRDEVPRKAKKYSLDQLKLVGIVGGEEQPRAMLVDPRGKGWIVARGDHVGRAELKTDHLAGWRVDRVRGDDVVFVRTDPRRPEQAAETRVLALHAAAPPSDDAEIDD